MNMVDEVLKALIFYHGENNFNVNPHVPTEIEHYARAVLEIPDDEYIIAAMRTSFTKFHRGIVFGLNGIYWRNGANIETDVTHLTWQQLSDRKKTFRALRTKVTLGENTVFDNTGSLNKTSIIINLLDLLLERYDDQEQKSSGFIFTEADVQDTAITIPPNKSELKAENEEAEGEDKTESLGVILTSIAKKIFLK